MHSRILIIDLKKSGHFRNLIDTFISHQYHQRHQYHHHHHSKAKRTAELAGSSETGGLKASAAAFKRLKLFKSSLMASAKLCSARVSKSMNGSREAKSLKDEALAGAPAGARVDAGEASVRARAAAARRWCCCSSESSHSDESMASEDEGDDDDDDDDSSSDAAPAGSSSGPPEAAAGGSRWRRVMH
jgi:hypothetical protein